MAKMSEMVVTIRADTRPLHRELNRVQRRLRWMFWRERFIAVAAFVAVIGAFLVGLGIR
jgi:hypothetical protein